MVALSIYLANISFTGGAAQRQPVAPDPPPPAEQEPAAAVGGAGNIHVEEVIYVQQMNSPPRAPVDIQTPPPAAPSFRQASHNNISQPVDGPSTSGISASNAAPTGEDAGQNNKKYFQ